MNRFATSIAIVLVSMAAFASNGCATHGSTQGRVTFLQRDAINRTASELGVQNKIWAEVSVAIVDSEKDIPLAEEACKNEPDCMIVVRGRTFPAHATK